MSALPNLIVIGATKCATSSVHYYLDLHPEVFMSKPKELHFFVTPGDLATAAASVVAPAERALYERVPTKWPRGLGWYADQFEAKARVRGESSPSYTLPHLPGVAARIAAHLPEARIVFMVRDPVERAISHYAMRRNLGSEDRALEEAFRRPDNVYFASSRYASCLEPYLVAFGRERILVAASEDLRDRPRETMRAIFTFAGVDPSFWSDRMLRRRNPGAGTGAAASRTLNRVRKLRAARLGYRLPQEAKWLIERATRRRGDGAAAAVVEPALRDHAADSLRDDTQRFRELAGVELPAWSV